MTKLESYGWNSLHEKHFTEKTKELKAVHYVPGRVTLEHKRMYRVVTETGEWLSVCSGSMEYAATERRDFPAVGDWVVVEKMPGEERGIIHAILPRTSLFSRKVAGTAIEEQLIATNVDFAFLVMSMNKDFNARRLERYLVATYDSGAVPVVVLTKKDISEDPAYYTEEARTIALGANVYQVSSVTREGIDQLQALCKDGKTAALLGSSGVGKSSLTNALLNDEKMSVQDIRQDDDKGRHTTTHRELFTLPSGGIIIDTPGMREFQLWDNNESLDSGFVDIESLAANCKFNDCQHNQEPGCAVQNALSTGDLTDERYASYLKLQKELLYIELKANQQARKQAQSKRKNISKHWRQFHNFLTL